MKLTPNLIVSLASAIVMLIVGLVDGRPIGLIFLIVIALIFL